MVSAIKSPGWTTPSASSKASACINAVSRSVLVSMASGRTLRYSAILRCDATLGVIA
ncbi:hypothetical protein D3C84_1209590 [compost metagenome]